MSLGTAIAGSLGRYGEEEVQTNGHVDPQKVLDFVPPVYGMVLKDAEKWHPGLKEEVKDKETGEVQEKPVDFEKYCSAPSGVPLRCLPAVSAMIPRNRQ